MLDLETVFTVYYSIPAVITQLIVCTLLWRQTRDRRTWGLLVIGSTLSIIARFVILNGTDAWIDDLIRASSITINTLGFFSLYFLLKKLIEDKKKS